MALRARPPIREEHRREAGSHACLYQLGGVSRTRYKPSEMPKATLQSFVWVLYGDRSKISVRYPQAPEALGVNLVPYAYNQHLSFPLNTPGMIESDTWNGGYEAVLALCPCHKCMGVLCSCPCQSQNIIVRTMIATHENASGPTACSPLRGTLVKKWRSSSSYN